MVLAFSMFTDIAEFIDWKSGQQMTGLTVSASIFGVKVGTGLGAFVAGFTLELTGFVRDVPQTQEALDGINLAFATLPALSLLPGGIAMLFYHLSHEKMREVEADLAARREALT